MAYLGQSSKTKQWDTYDKADVDSKDALKADTTYVDNKPTGFKNLIINGGFDIWQRGNTFLNPSYQTFMADRWDTSSGITNGTVYNDGAVMAGSKNSFRIDNTVKSDVYIRTALELDGKNFYEGQKLVLSYYVLSSSVFSFGAKIQTRDTKNLATNETIHYFDAPLQNTASTWTRIEIPITLGIISATNTTLVINITVLNFIGTLRYANVQLEEGSVATPFEQRPYGLELSLCQRYYETVQFRDTSTLVAGYFQSINIGTIKKRVNPSIQWSLTDSNNATNFSSVALSNGCQFAWTAISSATTVVSGTIYLDAEL